MSKSYKDIERSEDIKVRTKASFVALLLLPIIAFSFLNFHISVLYSIGVFSTIALAAYLYDLEASFFAGSVVSFFLIVKILLFGYLTNLEYFSGMHIEILVESIIVSLLCVILRSYYSETKSQLKSIKSQQSKLEESEQLFRSLAENIDSVFWLSNTEKSEIYYVSPAFEKLFGSGAELLYESPLNYLKFVHEDDRDLVINLFRKPYDSTERERSEYRVTCANGDVKWVSGRSFAVKPSEGDNQSPRVVGFLDDVTHRKTYELSFESKNLQLKTMNKSLKEFVAVASHDLQEPLRKVRTYASILQNELESVRNISDSKYVEISGMTKVICDSTERMQNLIRDLLVYSNLTKKDIPLKPINIGSAIKEAMESLSLNIQQNSPSIVLPENMPVVLGDQTGIALIFQNLIDNSLKYRQPQIETQILFEAIDEGSKWKILVQDNGIGIEEKNLEKIFKVFQRLHSKREYPGTGVGLAICRKNAQRYGGEIVARSTIGKGTTFIVSFPKLPSTYNFDKNNGEIDLRNIAA